MSATQGTESDEGHFRDLPLDVARLIIESAASHDRASAGRMALVSKTIKKWVEPALYFSVSLELRLEDDDEGSIELLQFAQGIMLRQDEAFFRKYVKHFDLVCEGASGVGYNTADLMALSLILKTCTDITSFALEWNIVDGSDTPFTLPVDNFFNSKHSNLKFLSTNSPDLFFHVYLYLPIDHFYVLIMSREQYILPAEEWKEITELRNLTKIVVFKVAIPDWDAEDIVENVKPLLDTHVRKELVILILLDPEAGDVESLSSLFALETLADHLVLMSYTLPEIKGPSGSKAWDDWEKLRSAHPKSVYPLRENETGAAWMFNRPRQGVMEPWEKAIQWKNIPIDLEERRRHAEAEAVVAEYRKHQPEILR